MADTDIFLIIGIIGIGAVALLYLLPQMQKQGVAAQSPLPSIQELAENVGLRVPDFSGQYTVAPTFVPNLARPGGGQTVIKPRFLPPSQTTNIFRPTMVPNLARPAGGQRIIKAGFMERPGTTITKPKYVANKILSTRCITEPFSDGNYWRCYYPNGRTVKQGKWWKCGGLLAMHQGLGHVCRP